MSDWEQPIRDQIESAFQMAQLGKIEVAMHSFVLARSMCVGLSPPSALATAVAKEEAKFIEERLYYQQLIAEHGNPVDRPSVLVLSDSLGLPSRLSGDNRGADMMYPSLLSRGAGKYRVKAVCQRYMTTTKAVSLLEEDAAIAGVDRAIIHLGINDRANRMFLESERVSLSLLTEDLRDRFLEFVRLYRHHILKILPRRQYVDEEAFVRNLDVLINVLKSACVKRIILSTILYPASKLQRSDPSLIENITRYNLHLMQASARHNIKLFDFDRLIWAAGVDDYITADGIHLTAKGHKLFANQVPLMFR